MTIRYIAGFCALMLALCVSLSGADAGSVADAVMTGNKTALLALLQKKADVNMPRVDGATAIHWAAYNDDVVAADLLIQAGANVRTTNIEGVTPMLIAAESGSAAMIDRLLKAGASAVDAGPNGVTPLMMAARNGNPAAIKRLLDAGANVNAKETLRSTTALMWASEQGHAAAVKVLIDGGADFKLRSGTASIGGPYLAATVPSPNSGGGGARGGAGAGRNAQGGQGNGARGQRGAGAPAAAAASTPVQTAVQDDRSQDQDAVAASGVGNAAGGLTALMFAARQSNIDVARVLLAAGADVNQLSNQNWTALLTATKNMHYNMARFLIERGADVNRANAQGWTPLYLATDNRNIEAGDYPAQKPDSDHIEFIRLLLDRGANPNARLGDKNADTDTRTIFTMQWLFEEGATPFVRAAQSGDLVLMKLLLEHGADPKIPTAFGDTALSTAAGIGWVDGVTFEWSPEASVETVKMLLSLGLDPNSKNHDDRTPLMAAALKGRPEVIQLLADAGAKLDARDHGSRDTKDNSPFAGHSWEAVDYAEGLVRVGVQSAVFRPEAARLLRTLLADAGLKVPASNRKLESVCIVEGMCN